MLLATKLPQCTSSRFANNWTFFRKKIPGRTMAKKCEQDNLCQLPTSLKNYYMQFKILSSVKEALIED